MSATCSCGWGSTGASPRSRHAPTSTASPPSWWTASASCRKNQFANPAGLVQFMQKSTGRVKLQPDHKLVFRADWPQPEDRLRGVRALVRQLAEVAGAARKAA